nr:class I histocompatibility antigen, F10 alpha chain-like isoform X2 [Agelaius phoeniceus]
MRWRRSSEAAPAQPPGTGQPPLSQPQEPGRASAAPAAAPAEAAAARRPRAAAPAAPSRQRQHAPDTAQGTRLSPLPPPRPAASPEPPHNPARLPPALRPPPSSAAASSPVGPWMIRSLPEIAAPMAGPEAALRAGPGLWAGPQRSSAMAPALGLGLLLGLLGLLVDPGGATKVLHSLRYLNVAVSEPSAGIPQFMDIGFVDGIPFMRFDSERGRAEPLTQWMKDGIELEYWDRETQIAEGNQHVYARNLEILRERYNQSRGLHTLLWVYGCDLLSDGSVHGSRRNGYDGRDFISFDLESRRFVPADSAAEITRRRWEQEGTMAEDWTNYLKHECPEELQRFIGYGQKELERKEPPDVHVSGREEHGTLILSCHVYGFYPNTIAVSWMKGGETLDQETEWGGIVPNSDGTFHTWARIEALPEEREQYRCRVEHPGMPEPGIFAWEPTSGGNLFMVVAVSVIAAILILIFIGFGVWKLQSGNTRDGGREGTRIHPAPFWESCATNSDPTLFPQGGGTGMDTTQQPVSSNGGSSSGSPLCGSQDGSWG